jgi:hypothetical protein
MTTRINPLIALSLAAGLAGAGVGTAKACGFDGIMLNGFEALHPKSIDVSIAIRAAYEAGMVDRSAIEPITPGSPGYWRAVGHLTALQRSLIFDDVNPERPAISVLLVDSSLWSRIASDSGPQGLQVHTAGARDNDVVLLTNEAVLVAILERRLSPVLALEQGLLRVEGGATAAESVRQAILKTADAADMGATGAGARMTPFFNVKRQ